MTAAPVAEHLRDQPPPVAVPDPTAPVDRLAPAEKTRLRIIAAHALRLYPGAVGELISRELLAWEEFGFRIGDGALMARLAEKIRAEALAAGL